MPVAGPLKTGCSEVLAAAVPLQASDQRLDRRAIRCARCHVGRRGAAAREFSVGCAATAAPGELAHPSTKHLYSLYASRISRINFVPYQFRPVLKLIQADRPRLLIADEVGVGKTIEAGLILKELQARRELKSVLVICPKPLVAERKWMEELKRFDEQFTHIDGDALRYCIEETHLDGVWPQQYSGVPRMRLPCQTRLGSPVDARFRSRTTPNFPSRSGSSLTRAATGEEKGV
jgi:hypothetical protein